MKQLTYCIFAIAFMTACSGKSDIKTASDSTEKGQEDLTQTTPEESNGAIEIEQPEAAPELTWKDLGPGEYDIPRTQIILTVGDKKTFLDTISNECSEIPKSEYKSYGIPKDALSAFGGWYAGGGDYFYLSLKKGKPAVYHGWQDEAQEDNGYHWKAMSVK